MIIGISGKIGSGKDALAELIKINSKRAFVIKKFADNLKEICSIISGRSISEMYTIEGKNIFIPEFNMTVGAMQQKIGTEVFRNNFDNDLWVKSLFTKYSPDQNWLVTDVRFPNEADYIKSKGGIVIRIDGDPRKVRENSTRDLTHPSEIGLDDYKRFNEYIVNNDSFEYLESKAKEIATNYKL